jgi:hypothetical protein
LTYIDPTTFDQAAVLRAIRNATGTDNVAVERTDFKIKVTYDFSSVQFKSDTPVEEQVRKSIAAALSVAESMVVVTNAATAQTRRLSGSWDAQVTTANAADAAAASTAATDVSALSTALAAETGNDVILDAATAIAEQPKTELTVVTKVVVPEGSSEEAMKTTINNDVKTAVQAAVPEAIAEDPVSEVITASPTPSPTKAPTNVGDTYAPTQAPTAGPTAAPTAAPTAVPTANPTAQPTAGPTAAATANPTVAPTTGGDQTANNTTAPAPAPNVESDWAQGLGARFLPFFIVAAIAVRA